ncbi:formate dehydrogenase delta subunit [Collimonas sp. OK307]|nr:formate dehydrogenase delta subunit [Collimonas sp. OK307]
MSQTGHGKEMNPANLIRMANQIGSFFETMPDREQAQHDIASHIKRFWEPRMRRSLLQYVDQHDGAELMEIVLDTLRKQREAVV